MGRRDYRGGPQLTPIAGIGRPTDGEAAPGARVVPAHNVRSHIVYAGIAGRMSERHRINTDEL
ncbi:hypothetical protein MKOR_04460 [Mycolicibacillus koreensis]|nr:hypothetical protein MKOR_04460 [Mycolicibacillus koreensis]